ncbi:TonB-dependent receptor [Sphingomonas aliaeris]|uniref:TonB-dependent receptor n=1 Tax=Sphingomonas aliaeris TaxID=2759526 RepID=A0A974NSC9_9SPHN|nr:TonB-dependent receptor [Sphingomonas aliaeris]QQV75968.1 TonB-dependent receptor [Sphingomonas aliaeris]
MAFPAAAQEAPNATVPGPTAGPIPAETNAEPVAGDEIVVTGSRIARSGFTSPTPTTVLGAAELDNAGVTNVGQLAQQIPAFTATFTPATSTLQSQLAGAAFLNLRNLGNNRTLVLVNSRRFVSTTTGATVDTNVVPSSLIERVEVVTGGASAAYGSDAVAGVVNLILKRNVQGVTGEIQSGISTYGDNATYKGSLAWGTGFADGAGHFTIAAEGEKNEGVLSQASRPWADGAYGLISNPAAGNPRRFILPGLQLANASLGGLFVNGPLRGTDFGPGGVPRPFVYGQYQGAYQIGGSGVEGSDLISLSVPFERYSFYSTGEYDFGGLTAFFEGSYSYSRGYNPRLTPPFNLGNITIQRDNAFLPAALAAQLPTTTITTPNFGRFSPDFGYFESDTSNRTKRIVAGLEGEIGAGWKFTIYGEYGKTDYRALLRNNVITQRFTRAVNSVLVGGVPTCRVNAVTVTDAACVPLNLFGQGSPSAAALDYIHGTQSYDVDIDQRVAAAEIQGNLFRIGKNAVTLAVGGEVRQDKVSGVSDAISQSGGFAIGNPRALAGKINVKEAFAEVLVPLIHDAPFFQALDLNGAIRVTDYSTSGTVTTWKGGATWQVNELLRLRATRSRDIRAPNSDELFTNALFRFAGISDPANNGSTYTVQIISQGNRALNPEIANTFTAGAVLTPGFVPGLRASVDYYDIKIRDGIGQLSAQETVDGCFTGNAEYCGFIARNGSNQVTSVTSTQVNVARQTTRGVDLELSYTRPLGDGTISIRGLGTYVDKLVLISNIDRVGQVGLGSSGVPRWKANASITYDRGPFTLFLQDRFVGGGTYDATYVEGVDINDNSVSGRNYVDLSLQLKVVDTPRQRVQLFFNVRNLLNQDPPHTPSTFQTPSQTNGVFYDVIGRQFATGVRFRF